MNTKILFFLLSGLLFLASCKPKAEESATTTNEAPAETTTQSADTPTDVDINMARGLIAGNPEIVLLDVRTPEEIANGKIGEAVELDFTDESFKTKVENLDKNKEYIVYCAAGGRSAKAVDMMKSMGFNRIHNLLGGYTAWTATK